MPECLVDILPDETNAAVAQSDIDAVGVPAAGIHNGGVGRGGCANTGQTLGGQIVAEGGDVNHIRAGGIWRHEGAYSRGIAPPGETAQIPPLTLKDFRNHHGVGQTIGGIGQLPADLLILSPFEHPTPLRHPGNRSVEARVSTLAVHHSVIVIGQVAKGTVLLVALCVRK